VNKAYIKIHSWDNPVQAESSFAVSAGDVVIVETSEEIFSAIVHSESAARGPKPDGEKSSPAKILRQANLSDLKIIKEHRQKEKEALKIGHDEVKKMQLPMKIIGAGYSFDGGSITFAFIADGRVDFRELVKNLAKKFQRSVRLHQVGARDESRQAGGYGICGRELCCVKFKGDLPSITSEMAKAQQLAHRGSERISGICGRLMCCLAYEADQYREMLEKFPRIGDRIKYNENEVVVKDINVISGEIRAENKEGSLVIINISELK